MIMELCHTNLGEVIKKRKMKNDYFTKSELKDFIGAMLPFFAKMQRKGYLHRDIKPDNILLVKNSYNKF
jgi:serine/threonine protein kinase